MENSLKPLISIIVPVFNRSDLLREALESVKMQSYENWEVVIVDDNSTENLEAMITKLLDSSKFKYIKNSRNLGPNNSRNIGLNNSKGSYVSFLDSDDIILPDKLTKLVNIAISGNGDYIYGGWCWKNFADGKFRICRVPIKHTGLINGLPRWCYNIVPDLVRTKVALKEMFSHEIQSMELYDFNIRLYKNYKVDFVPEILSHYRDHSGVRNSSNLGSGIDGINHLFMKHFKILLTQKKFSSNLRLTQGIYAKKLKKNSFKYFYKAFLICPFNFKIYYHWIK